jgi:hypothetical protein
MGQKKKGVGKKKKKREQSTEAPSSTLDSFLFDKEVAPIRTTEEKDVKTEPLKISFKEEKIGLQEPKKVMKAISTPEETQISFPKDEISASEARAFLEKLRQRIKSYPTVGIYFHNDMDGLNGALFIRSMIDNWFKNQVEIHASHLEYKEVQKLNLDDSITYIFVDMDIDITGENIFRIDHHGPQRDLKLITDRIFLLTPPENDYEYPSTATALCAYLDHISRGGGSSFFEFLNRGPWQNDQFSRLLILLASVCDNLWHLNFLIDIPIKRWIPDKQEERYLIIISISASIILGEESKRNEVVKRFFGSNLTPEVYLNTICEGIPGARNIMDFAANISREAEAFYNRIFFNLTDSIERSLKTLERDKDTHKKLEESMPIDMKGNRDKMMELLHTRGDLGEEHWRRVKFYGKEMEDSSDFGLRKR